MPHQNLYAQFLKTSKWKLPEIVDCEEIFLSVSQRTNLSPELIKKIISYFFLEIKINLISGYIVYIFNIGKFFISSPSFSEGKRKIYPNFMLAPSFRKKLNDGK